MKIIYTDHAQSRLAKRFIKREWIESAIQNPDKLLDADYGRKQAISKINSEEISVIYVVEGNSIVVLTVFWGE